MENYTYDHGIAFLGIMGITLNPDEEKFVREMWDACYDPHEDIMELLCAFYSEFLPGDSKITNQEFIKISSHRDKFFGSRLNEISLERQLKGNSFNIPKGMNPAYQ